MADLASARRVSVMESQEPLRYLAQETGGLFLASNDLGNDLNRVAADQSGYYLLGYVPSAGTFQPYEGEPRYRKVKIEVKRRGLKVRSRRGFFGVSEGDAGTPAPPPGGSLSGGATVAGVSP
jgi:VWFA-related protein